jgi:hypothetical protein
VALKKFHHSTQNSGIIHIESDVLLLPNFPFEAFPSLDKLSWQRVDESRDVASILFSPSYVETVWFIDELMNLMHANRMTTDMTGLHHIRINNPERVNVLPSFSRELGSEIVESTDAVESLERDLSSGVDLFKGIFDPAVFGMWLTGSDPRNYYGKQTLFDTLEILCGGTYLNPSHLEYIFVEPDSLYCQGEFERVRIWSLHVHSKDIRLLGSNWQDRLRTVVELSASNQVISEFRLNSLLNLALSNLRDRTFLSWILHIPKLHPILDLILRLRSTIRNIFR